MLIWSGWVVAAVLACAWAYREWRVRLLESKGRGAVESVVGQLDEALTLSSQLACDHDAMRESVEKERKRAEDYFSVIEGVTAERDARMRLYYAQATEHGAAQAMLLRQLESLVKQFQRATNGKMPKLNPAVELVTREFHMNHVEPAQAEMLQSPVKSGVDGG
jgi:hypothetical protein